MPCTQAKFSATGRVLLAWMRPMKCQVSSRPASAVDFRQAFLQEILAEVLDSGARRRINCCGALTLRNGQKRDGIDISSGRAGSDGDACLYLAHCLRAILRKG